MLGLIPVVFATLQHVPSEKRIVASLNAGGNTHEIGELLHLLARLLRAAPFLSLCIFLYTTNASPPLPGSLQYEIPATSTLKGNKYPGLALKFFQGRQELKITSLKVVNNFWYDRGVGVAAGLLDHLAACLGTSHFFMCRFFPVFNEHERCDAGEDVWTMCVEFATRFQMKVAMLDAEHGMWFMRRAGSLHNIRALPKSTLLAFIPTETSIPAVDAHPPSQPSSANETKIESLVSSTHIAVPTYDPAQLQQTWDWDETDTNGGW
jgi:hypothetical protein